MEFRNFAQEQLEKDRAIMSEYEDQAYSLCDPAIKVGARILMLEVLAFAYFEDDKSAITIAKDLGLTPLHLYSVLGDRDGFTDELYKLEMQAMEIQEECYGF